jgi:WD40 repeat protein
VTWWEGAYRFYRVRACDKVAFSIPRERSSNKHAPIAFSPDGSLGALALNSSSINLIRVSDDGRPTYRSLGTLKSPDRFPLEKLAFSPDGRRLAVSTESRSTASSTVQLWNLALLRDSLANLNLQEGWPAYE